MLLTMCYLTSRSRRAAARLLSMNFLRADAGFFGWPSGRCKIYMSHTYTNNHHHHHNNNNNNSNNIILMC